MADLDFAALRAAIEHRRELAAVLAGERWGTYEDSDGSWCVRILSDDPEDDGQIVCADAIGTAVEHIAMNDPARVLRDCAEDLAVLEIAEAFDRDVDNLRRNEINPWHFEIAARKIRESLARRYGRDEEVARG